jgi:DNA-binding winged helix-turn-helix (wHTH) protein/cytochrome c-type biogenesis protein CcmH/NrfG
MRTLPPERVRFDAFTLDLSRCILLREGIEIPLRPQAFDLLRYLAERPGRLLSKAELLNAVWPDVTVGEDSLVKCVKNIREALGDHDQRIIKTVRGRGYLFAADTVATSGGARPPQTTDADAQPWLRVRSVLNTARRHILSAGWRGAAVLAAALVVVAAGVAAWALRVPAVASNAAHYAILARAILDNERSAQANRDALTLYGKALALNPDWVPALLGYARVMIIEVGGAWVPLDERPARVDQAEAAIERAIKLDPTNAFAHQLRGVVLRMRGDLDRAVAAFERSLELNPSGPWTHAEFARTKIDLGRADEALADIETALRLHPSENAVHVWYCWAGMAALHAGRNEEAVQWLLKARDARPTYALPVPLLAVAYVETGREAEGRALMARFLARAPGLTIQTVQRDYPSWNATVGKQRERITGVLRRIGVPDASVQTGSVR